MTLPGARFSSRKARRLAERAMQGALRQRQRQALARLLRASEQDRQAYSNLAALFGALERRAPALSQGQREGILQVVQREVAAGSRLGGRRPAGWLTRLAPALALLIVGFAAAVALRPPSLPWPASAVAPGFQHRGSTAIGRAGRLGIKAYCIRAGEVLPPPALRAGDALAARCRLDDELQLTLTHTAGFFQLLVIGDMLDATTGRHTLTWYHPAPPTGRSAPAPALGVDEALGQSRRLRLNHRPGNLRVVAVFSRQPVEARSIYAALQELDRGEPAGPALERVDRQGQVEMTAVDLHVMIEGEAR